MSDYQFSLKPKKVPSVRTKFRTIKTAIPSPETVSIIKESKKYHAGLMPDQLPMAWHQAVGFNVFDPAGNKWIDFTSTIFVANSGHANPKIKKAVKDQLDNNLVHAYNYPTEVKNKFLAKLVKMAKPFAEGALLFSSGTEANESILTILRAYGQQTQKNKIGIVSFQNAMHGVTMGAQMLKGNQKVLPVYGFKDPHIFHLPFPFSWEGSVDWKKKFNNDLADLVKKGMKPDNLCGLMLEAYQGWGVLFYPPSYLEELLRFVRRNKLLLAVDEIQGGCGRTGKMFTFEHYGLKPDLIALGKGLSSSLPLSAVLGSKKLLALAEELDVAHSTHSGNPLSCAAGLANLEEFESRNLIKESERKGKILLAGLNNLKRKFPDRIAHVFGAGLLAAVLFKNPKTGQPESEFPSRVCERAMQKGLLLVHTGRESIKIAPPLTIPDSALKEGISVLEEAITEIEKEFYN